MHAAIANSNWIEQLSVDKPPYAGTMPIMVLYAIKIILHMRKIAHVLVTTPGGGGHNSRDGFILKGQGTFSLTLIDWGTIQDRADQYSREGSNRTSTTDSHHVPLCMYLVWLSRSAGRYSSDPALSTCFIQSPTV